MIHQEIKCYQLIDILLLTRFLSISVHCMFSYFDSFVPSFLFHLLSCVWDWISKRQETLTLNLLTLAIMLFLFCFSSSYGYLFANISDQNSTHETVNLRHLSGASMFGNDSQQVAVYLDFINDWLLRIKVTMATNSLLLSLNGLAF